MEFDNEYLKITLEFRKWVWFSDWCACRIKGKKLVCRKKGTMLRKENLLPTVKYASPEGFGKLAFRQSAMVQYGYLNILIQNLQQNAQQLEPRIRFIVPTG